MGRIEKMERKRAFIIHGWTGRNNQDWFPWALEELKERDYDAYAPAMPNPDSPVISEWLGEMTKVIGELKATDILIGHSMGCQAVLRYLDQRNEYVDKVILIAGWEILSEKALPLPEDHEIVKPWYETPINYEKVKKLANVFVALFSDNDPWVPLEANQLAYKKNLDAEVIVEHNKGHFMKEVGGVTEIPVLLKYI